jgi:subtilisin family serine protease
VIGVSAIRENGSVPAYSNRDVVYNDLAAPGDAIFSTIPSNLEEQTPTCAGVPYSNCGPFEFRDAIGTSFAAPQVTAAAALLLGQDPTLRPEQVAWLLERSADDARPSTGCAECPAGRDKYTGWGTLDIESALNLLGDGTALPAVDHYEPNDDAGVWSHALPPLPRTIDATLDYWDDNIDVYRIYVHKGGKLFARVTPDLTGSVRMSVWAPGTSHVDSLATGQVPLVQSRMVGAQARLSVKAKKTGAYYLELRLTRKSRDPVSYGLAVAKT